MAGSGPRGANDSLWLGGDGGGGKGRRCGRRVPWPRDWGRGVGVGAETWREAWGLTGVRALGQERESV